MQSDLDRIRSETGKLVKDDRRAYLNGWVFKLRLESGQVVEIRCSPTSQIGKIID